jgi:hypothetical protein
LKQLADRFHVYHATKYTTYPENFKAAFFYLFIHELFHYFVDNATSILEITIGKSGLYTKYSSDIYCKVYGTSECLEEALANRYLFGRYKTFGMKRDYLRRNLLRQKPGYRDYINYLGGNFWKGRRQLLSQILTCDIHPIDRPIEQILEMTELRDYSTGHRVPLWLHRSMKGKRVIKRIATRWGRK